MNHQEQHQAYRRAIPKCEKCGVRSAIKTDGEGVELCDHCATGTVDPARRTAPKVGRNERCLCGSGQKFKQCCLPKQG